MSSLEDYFICPFCNYIYGDKHSSKECVENRNKSNKVSICQKQEDDKPVLQCTFKVYGNYKVGITVNKVLS